MDSGSKDFRISNAIHAVHGFLMMMLCRQLKPREPVPRKGLPTLSAQNVTRKAKPIAKKRPIEHEVRWAIPKID